MYKPSAIWVSVMLGLLAIALVTPSMASSERTAGVKAGDWADYVVTFEGNSTEELTEDFVNVTGMRLEILDVVDPNVTLRGIMYFENGSDTSEAGWIDVDTGHTGGDFNASGVLIAANLSEGDRVYTDNQTIFLEGTINETATRNYLGQMLAVNRFIWNLTTPPNPLLNMTFNWNWTWIKETGLPVEMDIYFKQEIAPFHLPAAQEPSSNMTWFKIHITIVNIIPEFPASAVLPLFLSITVAIAALAKIMKQRKPRAYQVSLSS